MNDDNNIDYTEYLDKYEEIEDDIVSEILDNFNIIDDNDEYIKSDDFRRDSAFINGIEGINHLERNFANEKLHNAVNSFFELSLTEQEDFTNMIDYYNKTADDNSNDKLDMMMKMMNEMNEKINNKPDAKKEKIYTAEEIEAIYAKERINKEEFQVIFHRGVDAQKNYRNPNKYKNPLPTYSKGGSGNDTIYNRIDAEKWMKRYKGYKPNKK